MGLSVRLGYVASALETCVHLLHGGAREPARRALLDELVYGGLIQLSIIQANIADSANETPVR